MCCPSSAAQVNAEIAKRALEEAAEERRLFKVLLLGAGESGKTTISKHIQHIYSEFKEQEITSYAPILRRNTVEAMAILCQNSKKFVADGDEKADVHPELADIRDTVSQVDTETDIDFTPALCTFILKLWADPGIQYTFDNRSKYHLIDTAAYLFDNCGRYQEDNFIPTIADIMRTRVMTTGMRGIDITKTEDNGIKNNMQMYDVGGQRNERRKWIHVFDEVDVLLFVVSISSYDQVCWEDGTTNRVSEALRLFDETINNKAFRNTDVVLLFNKRDIFQEKIQKVPLTVCTDLSELPAHEAREHDRALEHVKAAFLSRDQNDKRRIRDHYMSALEPEDIREVVERLQEIITEIRIQNPVVLPVDEAEVTQTGCVIL